MKPFVAIDFETADPKRDSACAVGLARVEGDRIVYRESALIRPPRGMHPMNQSVHGLTYEQVRNAPTFAQVWAKLLPILNGVQTLVAHNASFDRSVLTACCTAAGIDPPKFEWVCTLELARKKWPKPASHRLPDVCGYLGIEFANHHEAGADAEAAARVLIALEGRTATAPTVKAPNPPPVAAVRVSTGEAGAILAQIPDAHRTPAVLALMGDAEQLGPAHAADLVRAVARWFTREQPGRLRCQCGRPCTLLCSTCRRCIEAEA